MIHRIIIAKPAHAEPHVAMAIMAGMRIAITVRNSMKAIRGFAEYLTVTIRG